MGQTSQTELVALSRTGDKETYSRLVRIKSGLVFGLCLGMLGNIHDAEDITQQALLKGFTDIDKLQKDDRFEQWICQIARNICIDLIRRRTKERDVAREYIPKENKPVEYGFLEMALASLPEQYRTVLTLYYFDGHSSKNIGHLLDISLSAVHMRITRARQELRKILEVERDII